MSGHRRRSTLEKEIQRRIEEELGAEPDFLLMRNSVGHATYVDHQTGKEWHVPYGLGVGSPDLVGMLRVEARWLRDVAIPIRLGAWVCLEVKCPGEVAEAEQRKVHAVWRAFGACVAVVTSPEEARQALEDVRRSFGLVD